MERYAYFREWVWFNLRKFVLHIVWVHCSDLIPGGSAEHLYYLHQLINARLSGEQRLAQH